MCGLPGRGKARSARQPPRMRSAGLRLRGLQKCPEAFASSYEEEVGTPPAEIERRLQPKPDAAIFGAFREGVLVALVGVQREGMAKLAHKAFMWGVYVAPDERALGVGTKVLGHALSYGRTLGVSYFGGSPCASHWSCAIWLTESRLTSATHTPGRRNSPKTNTTWHSSEPVLYFVL